MKKKLAAIAAIACLASAPALAVVMPFGGPASGVDPLGHVWSASGSHWGEPGYGAGTIAFNPLWVTNDAGNYATSFSFTWLKGVSGTIDQTPSFTPYGSGPETRFSNITDGTAWLVQMGVPSLVDQLRGGRAARLRPHGRLPEDLAPDAVAFCLWLFCELETHQERVRSYGRDFGATAPEPVADTWTGHEEQERIP